MKGKAGLIASSGKTTNPSLKKSIARLNDFGFETVYSDAILERFLYYAGTDVQRAKQINDLYKNDEVKYIFCVRGGHGLIHAMLHLDFDLISKKRKYLIGFSDNTILLNYLYSAYGQIHFHGPHMNQKFEDDSIDFMRKVVFDGAPAIFNFDKKDVLSEGSEKAHIVGGNLDLVIRSIGTPFEINTENKIIFLEAWGKFSARIYEFLVQMHLAGKFDSCKGVIFGSFLKCDRYQPYIELFAEKFLKPKGIPVLMNQKFGHGKPNYTIPVGGICSLDTSLDTWVVEQ